MGKQSQCERLLNLLKEHEGEFVPLPEIMALRIASHTRRIFELRQSLARQNYQILIENEWTDDGERHTRYKLCRIEPQLTFDSLMFREYPAETV